MKISLCGAAGEVTGSGYLVQTDRATVLVDFGMFQGGGREDDERNKRIDPVDPETLDAIVLTHAHLDHCGRLPLLAKSGCRAPIHTTAASADFTDLVLADAANIQEMDNERENRNRLRAGLDPVPPLYTTHDVARVTDQFHPIEYDEERTIADGVTVRFVDAGHILGAASVLMTVQDAGATRTIAFSGDVGRYDAPILRNPVSLDRADLVFLESTYGDRDHRTFAQTHAEFDAILEHAIDAGDKVLIPAFALGRTQQILYFIAEATREKRIRHLPIYLDSPMAIEATELHQKHARLFDEKTGKLYRSGQLAIDLQRLHMMRTPQQSRSLNDIRQACVIIAGSGMCTGGRILHHLKHNLWRTDVALIAVGYMAEGTLGRKIVDGAKHVDVLGAHIAVKASVHTLGGFSAHAGQSELLRWLEPLAAHKPRLVLTHGENPQREALAKVLKERHDITAERPARGAVIDL